MSVRRLVVEIDAQSVNVTQFCAEHQISTWFFYDLRRRFARDGHAALEPKSRAPHQVANRTSEAVVDEIVALRKELLDLGLDAGPETIVFHLKRRGVPPPSVSTVWRVLVRRGFVTSEPKKVPKRQLHRFAATRANECWQLDDTAWELADGTVVKIINVIDDCTRVLCASRAVPTCTAAAVFDTVADAASHWGWPQRVLCDNAKAHHALHDTFAALGITTRHGRPYHPQSTGKVERLHRTVQQFLTAHDPASTITELQAHLDTFAELYNHERPIVRSVDAFPSRFGQQRRKPDPRPTRSTHRPRSTMPPSHATA